MNGSDAQFRQRLLRWYDRCRRDLPWRVSGGDSNGCAPDAYRVLLSEIMLQQTQVSRVCDYFRRFAARFPTWAELAAAEEQEVLRAWQGLGYYSRARNLQALARMVVGKHGGELPRTVPELLRLPGVGPYTAGAVASIAFGARAAAVDGNVTRVLCRLEGWREDPRRPQMIQRLWERAEALVPRHRPGDFNSAMMELGATICAPRAPNCVICPVQAHCGAFAEGLQDRIPVARTAKPIPLAHRWTFCIRHDGRWLLEQRPIKGRWGSMWQFVTVKAMNGTPSRKAVRDLLLLRTTRPEPVGEITHALTHRRYRFDIFRCEAEDDSIARHRRLRRWLPLDQLSSLPLPRPHLRIAELLASLSP